MLGRRVERVSSGAEDSRHRRRRDQMAALALDPARQHGPGGVDVRHDVDLPLALPQLVGSVRTAAGGDARVREPGVDRSHVLLNLADQRVGGLFVGYVESPR